MLMERAFGRSRNGGHHLGRVRRPFGQFSSRPRSARNMRPEEQMAALDAPMPQRR
jgi:hypothetical protein